jgi:hypothetical protein
MVGSGDIPISPAYHADLTLRHGVRYVWRGRTTSIIGQNAPITVRTLATIFHTEHPATSVRTMLKQAAKLSLGALGNPRWDLHTRNRVCRPTRLRNGQPVWEFMRSNPHWAGPGRGATAGELDDVLTPAMLAALVRSEGVCVLYTHLGKILNPRYPLTASAQAAVSRLARMHEKGLIFVTTTHRLLRYLTVRDYVRVSAYRTGGWVTVSIGQVDDLALGAFTPSADDVMGLTFVLDRCDGVALSLANGQILSCDVVHNGDKTIAAVPWKRLVFPAFD